MIELSRKIIVIEGSKFNPYEPDSIFSKVNSDTGIGTEINPDSNLLIEPELVNLNSNLD